MNTPKLNITRSKLEGPIFGSPIDLNSLVLPTIEQVLRCGLRWRWQIEYFFMWEVKNQYRILKDLAEFIIKVYAPMWFRIKLNSSSTQDSLHVCKAIELSRYLREDLRGIIDAVIQRNAYFIHPENFLLCMLTDNRRFVRELVLRRIVKARQIHQQMAKVRYFVRPKLNFILADLPDAALKDFIKNAAVPEFDFLKFPCQDMSWMPDPKPGESEVSEDLTDNENRLHTKETDAESDHSDHPTDSEQSDIEDDDSENCLLENYSRPRDISSTDMVEIKALFGLFYMASMKKAQHLNVKDLWISDGSGVKCMRSTVSRERFLLLLSALRFDNFEDRAERKAHDNLAAIRDVLDDFISKCKENYQVGEYSTIDEMLEPFRESCKFRQYIPAKYGIKVFSLADARTVYTSNIEVIRQKIVPMMS
ncbi:hypothetical protein ILUMI_21832 [Ignelater luminosus]|uniref:PiggyBac transposable element-derived protein domain-containing protein n=1 Tax=Ignelater luminosus TaxID=2038154 RepID=A0A8K0CFI7_IGNLU|nr:hypothetical protein ILUMI_21832 [Ignelater luminosus]